MREAMYSRKLCIAYYYLAVWPNRTPIAFAKYNVIVFLHYNIFEYNFFALFVDSQDK